MKFENISLVTRWGDGVRKPTEEDLRNALDELVIRDDEHEATWIEDEDGNAL